MFALAKLKHQYGAALVLELPFFRGQQGEHWMLQGLSGSGKSTLLHIMGGLLRPTSGTVTVAGQDLSDLSDAALDQFRGRHIGIIFQQLHLLRTLTVAQNLLAAQYMAGLSQDKKRVHAVLDSLDIGDKAKAYPDELSLGQQQRIAIGRAVVNAPKIILADEPTSALDDIRSTQVVDLLKAQAEVNNATLVVATHDQRIKPYFPHHLTLQTPFAERVD
ncbi:MAG: ABC transporter ATP-binding protein [Rhodothermales bacterium]